MKVSNSYCWLSVLSNRETVQNKETKERIKENKNPSALGLYILMPMAGDK